MTEITRKSILAEAAWKGKRMKHNKTLDLAELFGKDGNYVSVP